MGRHSRHYADLNPLEGGGGGGGGATPRVSGKLAGATAATMAAPMLALPLASEYMESETKSKKEREAKSEMKRESRGKEDSMTAGQKQSMQEAKDAEMQPKIRKAYEDSKNYKGGGMTASSRADGCATKGKTKGRFV